jgi:hypothetical protein
VTLLRAPLPRLLAGGALLAIALRVLGSPSTALPPRLLLEVVDTNGAIDSRMSARALPSADATPTRASDDALLYRAAAAAVSVDDPVVRGRLLRLAQYLEMGGTAEESDDELIAAARVVGLASEDVVLRRYLAELARLALARPAATDLPDEDELRAWIAAHPERFAIPERVRAHQVYLSTSRHGARLALDAAALLDDLRMRGVRAADAAVLGDPFARGSIADGTHDALARAFGEEFASALDTLPAGSWQGPIASPFGMHLVWIEQRTPTHVPPFDEVRGRALHAYLRERGVQRAQHRLAVLRCRANADGDCAG